jgi:hypothetical protein
MDANADQPARLETLQEEFAQLKAQNATIMSQQVQILQQLGGAIPTLTSPTTMPSSDTKLRPALTNEFDGDWTKGRAFLNSCELYVNLVPHQFADDEKAILWAISYENRQSHTLCPTSRPLLSRQWNAKVQHLGRIPLGIHRQILAKE